jgi:hypothetical protein
MKTLSLSERAERTEEAIRDRSELIKTAFRYSKSGFERASLLTAWLTTGVMTASSLGEVGVAISSGNPRHLLSAFLGGAISLTLYKMSSAIGDKIIFNTGELRFRNKPEKNGLAEMVFISMMLSRELHDKKIRNLILMDRGSRLAYISLFKCWGALYPGEKKPDVYFLNPSGFGVSARYNKKDILEEFKRIHSRLQKRRDEPVMIFDTCLHSGESMGSIGTALRRLGFNKIHTGLAQPPQNPHIEVDFMALPQQPYLACNPFFSEYLVCKGSRIISERNPDPKAIAIGRARRESLINRLNSSPLSELGKSFQEIVRNNA